MFSTTQMGRSQLFFGGFDECMFTTERCQPTQPTQPTPQVAPVTKEKAP
jgi:hypothetical protein